MKAAMKQSEGEPVSPNISRGSRQTAASVIGISKRFGKTGVLKDITFDVQEGETLVLLGASGSGKTTILRIIAGLEEPDTGSVILHKEDVTDLPARERGVGVIFQSYALFPKMNVEKNIGYGLKIRRYRRKEIKQRVNELLALVKLEEHRKKYPSQLSGGQQQRVAIARTLAYNPRVLLFDEPFGALDAQNRTRLRREIRALLKQVNVPSIFITHDQEEALELGDRIAVLNAGQLEQVGTPEEIYNHPATEYVATFLGAANVLHGIIGQNTIDVGGAELEVGLDQQKFHDGQKAKLVFRPEDVFLSKTDSLPEGAARLGNGVIQETSFVGAYERLTLRLVAGTASSKAVKGELIMATRPKPQVAAVRLKPGELVTIGLSSFTVLPADQSENQTKT
jgi:ABC-type Fe3+/spermidine/putrescine transport system ATPase subunit